MGWTVLWKCISIQGLLGRACFDGAFSTNWFSPLFGRGVFFCVVFVFCRGVGVLGGEGGVTTICIGAH